MNNSILTTISKLNTEQISAYLDLMPINHKQALLSSREKVTLHLLSKLLPKDSIILEVGSFTGGSASIMAHANTKASVIGIDWFDAPPTIDPKRLTGIHAFPKFNIPRSLESVQEMTKEFTNLKFLKGASPKDFRNTWNTYVDVYFDDASHINPFHQLNIDFWSKWIKPNGYLLTHGYNDPKHNFVDVDRWVAQTKENPNWEFIGSMDTLAIFKKTKVDSIDDLLYNNDILSN